MRRVREVPKGGCLASGSFERSEALLARLHDSREDFLELPRKHDVLDLDFQNAQAHILRLARGHLEELFSEVVALLKEIVDRKTSNNLAQSKLQLQVEGGLVVLDPVDRDFRIHDFKLRSEADLQRHTVGTQDFLAAQRDEGGTNVYLTDGREVAD